MAELFIELFSEEIPSKLQIDARQKIRQMLEERLQKKEIKFNLSKSFSTPQRLVFFIEGIPEKIEQKKSSRKSSFNTKKYILSHLLFSIAQYPLLLFGLMGSIFLIIGIGQI